MSVRRIQIQQRLQEQTLGNVIRILTELEAEHGPDALVLIDTREYFGAQTARVILHVKEDDEICAT